MMTTHRFRGSTRTQAVDTASWTMCPRSILPKGTDVRIRVDMDRATRLIVGATVTMVACSRAPDPASQPAARTVRCLGAVDRVDPRGRS